MPEKKDVKVPVLSERLDKLVLLSEVEPVVQEEVEPVEPINEEILVQDEKAAVCYTLGPYTDRDLVTKIESQIGKDVIDFVVREREEQELHRYWVYLHGDSSRENAREISKVLAKKEIKDYYIIQKGDKKNSISLGHFREKFYADVRAKQVRKLGFDPQIEVIYRTYSLYWLDYSLDDDKAEIHEKIQEYLVDGVTLLDRDCDVNKIR